MLDALRDTLRKLDCLNRPDASEQSELKRLLRRRIHQMEVMELERKRSQAGRG